MFSYYGSKSKIVQAYPVPTHDLIIEPFAGSARYSLAHGAHHNVLLIEKNPQIAEIWQWLITATKDEILSLPQLSDGEQVPNIEPLPRRNFLALMSNQGTAKPRNFAGRMGFKKWNPDKIVALLPLVRGWKVICGDYAIAPAVEATWFIDPPYIQADPGYGVYGPKNLDFNYLADWCRTRKGQVIVCEHATATWLPFKPLVELSGQRHTKIEGVWLKET